MASQADRGRPRFDQAVLPRVVPLGEKGVATAAGSMPFDQVGAPRQIQAGLAPDHVVTAVAVALGEDGAGLQPAVADELTSVGIGANFLERAWDEGWVLGPVEQVGGFGHAEARGAAVVRGVGHDELFQGGVAHHARVLAASALFPRLSGPEHGARVTGEVESIGQPGNADRQGFRLILCPVQ